MGNRIVLSSELPEGKCTSPPYQYCFNIHTAGEFRRISNAEAVVLPVKLGASGLYRPDTTLISRLPVVYFYDIIRRYRKFSLCVVGCYCVSIQECDDADSYASRVNNLNMVGYSRQNQANWGSSILEGTYRLKGSPYTQVYKKMTELYTVV